jgi:molybdopterin-guanine dinucleotide biosynthesis protein B
MYPRDSHIVAVASDVARPVDVPAGVAWLDLNAPEDVLRWLKGRIGAPA